jgi:solute carrier family 25 phosphate transporter 3
MGNGAAEVNKLLVSVCAAFIASLFACMFSQPGDMILTETYKKDEAPGRTFFDVVAAIHSRGGVGEFFRGTGARIVHVGMIITSQLVIYDVVKQALGLAATGSH